MTHYLIWYNYNMDMITGYLSLHVVALITFFLAFVTIGHMLSQRKKPPSMIAWTVVIIFLPYLGIIIYIIFNGRKITRSISSKKRVKLATIANTQDLFDSPLEHFLRQSDISDATNNNSFYLCLNSVDTYKQIQKRLLKAKKTVYISTYIFGNDHVTKELLSILTQKAKEGIEVKLLMDSFGSFSLELFPKILKPLKSAGGECHFFMSLLRHPIKNRLNLRNHRKMIIIDDQIVISGGINISKDYLSKNEEDALWCDLSFVIEGMATLYYRQIFQYDWEFQTNTKLKKLENSQDKADSIIQVVPSGPDVANDALYESILYTLYLAKKRVWIVSPYFVPDGSLMDALIIAKHRGVDIKIILPKTSDHFLADISRSGYLRDLQKEDIEILLFKPKMLHAKAMIVDDEVAMIGSLNFDARSFFYNFEVMSFVYSKEDIYIVSGWIKNLFDDCDLGLKPVGKFRLMVENFFKMLSPAL